MYELRWQGNLNYASEWFHANVLYQGNSHDEFEDSDGSVEGSCLIRFDEDD